MVAFLFEGDTAVHVPSDNLWFWAFGLLLLGILATMVPLMRALFRAINLDSSGPWFEKAEHLRGHKQRLIDLHQRYRGTLVYWKNTAATFHRLYIAQIFWSLLSGATLPVLIQFYTSSDAWAIAFMTTFTTWTGLIVAFSHTFKAEQKYQGLRQQESDYYDCCRQLLDFHTEDDDILAQRVQKFIHDVAAVRKVGRRVETGSPPTAFDA